MFRNIIFFLYVFYHIFKKGASHLRIGKNMQDIPDAPAGNRGAVFSLQASVNFFLPATMAADPDCRRCRGNQFPKRNFS